MYTCPQIADRVRRRSGQRHSPRRMRHASHGQTHQEVGMQRHGSPLCRMRTRQSSYRIRTAAHCESAHPDRTGKEHFTLNPLPDQSRMSLTRRTFLTKAAVASVRGPAIIAISGPSSLISTPYAHSEEHLGDAKNFLKLMPRSVRRKVETGHTLAALIYPRRLVSASSSK
jgi:hypothetical protein